jgi:hypothetical protein
MSRRDWIIGLVLAVGTVACLLSVEGRQGIGRDEAMYFRAGERYLGWFEGLWRNGQAGRLGASFSRATLEEHWRLNAEHPPLMKVLYGLSWRLFHRCDCPAERALHPDSARAHRTLALFARDSSAFRFPAIVFAGLAALLVFVFARQVVSAAAAAAGAVLAVAQPHGFFHAQISCLDAPITTMALLVGLAYWKSLRSRRWAVLCGVSFGLALAVKHNAWLMPMFLLAHYLYMHRATLRRGRLPPFPLAFLAMAVIGPLVLFVSWPWLWTDPFEHARSYVLRHLRHEHYNLEYLGLNWNRPPADWDLQLLRATYPFVATALTVPVTTLALAVVGAVGLRRRRASQPEQTPPIAADSPGTDPLANLPARQVDHSLGAFLGIQVLGPMLVIALPVTPIFGGVKHFLPAMPYLAILAALGLQRLSDFAGRAVVVPGLRRWLPACLAVLVCLPAVIETRRSHPDGLTHYNLIAGGFAGGASMGMNRQFWAYSVLPMLDWLVQNRPAADAIYWHDVIAGALVMYVRDGRLPEAMATGRVGPDADAIAQSELGMVFHEQHFTLTEGLFWTNYGTTRPVYVRSREGVPLVTVYRRPSSP